VTYEAALHAADHAIHDTGQPQVIYEHTGTAKILPQGRFIVRPADAPPPKSGWTHRFTILLTGEHVDA
jgi:hypothetical protein